MFLRLQDFLDADTVSMIAAVAGKMRFVDGRNSNPGNLAKLSLVADPSDAAGQKVSKQVLAALSGNERFQDFARPSRIASPLVCRYESGMKYGAHVDAAHMPALSPPLRSDMSCTVWISDPTTYEGGELVIHLGTEIITVKEKPGSAIFYPSTTVHQVLPVRSGERVVVITFIESMIADQLQRDLLFSLSEVWSQESPKMEWRNRVELDYVIQNLRRMWSS